MKLPNVSPEAFIINILLQNKSLKYLIVQVLIPKKDADS